MADFPGLVALIKQAAAEAVERGKPSGVYFGTVTSVSPIQITIDQNLILPQELIVLGRYITEFSLDYTIPGELWHGLRKGDELLLVREQGGQRYVVTDWVKRVEEDTRPAWVMVGTVTSSAPDIKVNDYLTLTPENLILCRNVTEYSVDMDVSHVTELRAGGGGDPAFAAHDHDYLGRKKFLVHNGLVPGDTVLLVCQRSLKKWFVVDFISRSASEVIGQWL